MVPVHEPEPGGAVAEIQEQVAGLQQSRRGPGLLALYAADDPARHHDIQRCGLTIDCLPPASLLVTPGAIARAMAG